MRHLPALVWCLVSTIWGSTWLFIKIGVQDLHSLSFAGLRFAFAASILWTLFYLSGRSLPRSSGDFGVIGLIHAVVSRGVFYPDARWHPIPCVDPHKAELPSDTKSSANFSTARSSPRNASTCSCPGDIRLQRPLTAPPSIPTTPTASTGSPDR